MTYRRFTEADKLRARLMRRDTPYRVRIEEDHDHNPRNYDCYTEDDYQKFESGEYRAWKYTIYRACPDHAGMHCPHVRVVDSLCDIGVLEDTDLEDDYTSPYLIRNDYLRGLVWEAWQTRKGANDYADAVAMIADSFRYETCAECGGDLDRHVISPGPFGLPFAWCMTD